jgi:hypothetical protein
MPAKKASRAMSSAHKEALALGRNQSRAVRVYLEALEANKPKRGRKRTPDSIKKRLATIDNELQATDALRALNLRQERRDLEAELENLGSTVDLSAIEKEFVASAKPYGERKGISYGVWREAGVSAEVLKKAGITR